MTLYRLCSEYKTCIKFQPEDDGGDCLYLSLLEDPFYLGDSIVVKGECGKRFTLYIINKFQYKLVMAWYKTKGEENECNRNIPNI